LVRCRLGPEVADDPEPELHGADAPGGVVPNQPGVYVFSHPLSIDERSDVRVPLLEGRGCIAALPQFLDEQRQICIFSGRRIRSAP